MKFHLPSRIAVEFLGTAFLLAAVVGSGIMGERLAAGNVAIALLANSLATGAILVVLVLIFGPVSGAHLNPAVTLAMGGTGNLAWREVPAYLAAQSAGAFAGVASAHLMFGLPVFFASTHSRHGAAPTMERNFGNLRIVARDLGMRTIPACSHGLRGRRLHHRRLLVHIVHLVRQPGGHAGALSQ